MLEIRDPAIKLFGKTIPLHSDGPADVVMLSVADEVLAESNADDASNSEHKRKEIKHGTTTTTHKGPGEEQPTDAVGPVDNPKAPTQEETQSNHQIEQESDKNDDEDEEQKPDDSIKEDSIPLKDHDKDDQGDTKRKPQEKTLKKPDKILPCPRCNSMDTKFCYYNNYNVNQPRHFCKSCQRYWTAGGTMRNVPVGAGRRKNKTSGARYCQISVPNPLQAAQINLPNGAYNQQQQHHHHPVGLKANGTVLTFGGRPYAPLCESMASVLNIGGEKKDFSGTENGVHKSCESGDDRQTASSTVTTGGGSGEGGGKPASSKDQVPQILNGFANQVPSFSGFQWPYGWNSCVPFPPGFCPPAGFTIPFYAPPIWNGVAPVPWNVPWVSSSCSSGTKSPSSNPNSPLGKHSRDGETIKPNDPERSSGSSLVLVPKTLRIDDPEEAAKSSIWTTLGISKDSVNSAADGGFFKGLQAKKLSEEKSNSQGKVVSTSPVLKANPAALARSISLKERA